MLLRFEQLTVYRKSIELLDLVIELGGMVPAGKGLVYDHAERAIWSIIINLGEGSCEHSRGDKNKFYRYALRSAGECVAAFTILSRYPGRHHDLCTKALALAREIVMMITRMIMNPRVPREPARKPLSTARHAESDPKPG
jgi:four helix bundle protein